MKKIFPFLSLILLVGISSCRRDNNPQPQPQQATFVDEYDNDDNNWGFNDNMNLASGYVNNGTYKMFYDDTLSPSYYISKKINRWDVKDDFTIYTRIGSNNNMGLLFGYQTGGNGAYGYTFTIDYDGYFALYDEGGNGYGPNITEIVPPQTNAYVKGNGDWNEVKLVQKNNRWIGYINEVEAFNVPAKQIIGENLGYVLVSNTAGEADYIQINYWPY